MNVGPASKGVPQPALTVASSFFFLLTLYLCRSHDLVFFFFLFTRVCWLTKTDKSNNTPN